MRKTISLHTLMFLLISVLSQAQSDYQQFLGLIIDEQTTKASIEALPHNYGLGTKADDVPLDYSLMAYTPTPRAQSSGTCVGFSISSALSICLFRRDSITSQAIKDENVISATFIYNNIKAPHHGCKEGARIPDGLEWLKTNGSCRAVLFEDTEENCSRLPDEAALKEAATNKIKDYISVFHPDDEDIMQKVFKTKKQLSLGTPIVIGMDMPGAFFLKHDFTKAIDLSTDTEISGGHAMCVVGYNDYMGENGAFQVMNSWGKEWGDGGFFWLSYEDYAKYVKCGFAPVLGDEQVVIGTDEDKQEITLTGEFSFRTPGGFDESGRPAFKEKAPDFNGKNYLINDWKRLKVYQLLGQGMMRNSYTYVFSIDAEDKTELHFPESTGFTDLLTADKVPLQKAIVQNEDETIIIPGEHYALQTVHLGTDNICVIYSYDEIPDIQERIEKARNSNARNIHKRVQTGFDDILIPPKDINYTKGKMGFTATSDKGTAVPIILEVVVK